MICVKKKGRLWKSGYMIFVSFLKYLFLQTGTLKQSATVLLIMPYALETRAGTYSYKTRQMFEANEMKVQRKIFRKTKIDRVRSRQIRKSCGIQPINEWMEIRREWD